MSLIFADTPNTSAPLVAAAADKIIRVRRVVVGSEASGWVQLVHTPEGAATPISCRFFVRAAGSCSVDLSFPNEAPQTPRGASLGLSTTLDLNWSVWIEYELVT